jgi:hypothetical protein
MAEATRLRVQYASNDRPRHGQYRIRKSSTEGLGILFLLPCWFQGRYRVVHELYMGALLTHVGDKKE